MLDFSQVVPQIHAFAGEQVRGLSQFHAALDEACRRLEASDPHWEALRAKIAESRTSWLVAAWREASRLAVAPSPRPLPYTVLAADGSQIIADRHDIAPCYLLNVGCITIRYGTGERATLTSKPELASPDEDLPDDDPTDQGLRLPKRVAIRRQLAEIRSLAELIQETSAPSPAPPRIALTDGSLILWTLETERDAFRTATLETFQQHLDTARQHRVPIVGYISRPQSRDVVNGLRVFQCPFPRANCDAHCPNRSSPKPHTVVPDCAGAERITDAEMFERTLQPGERTAVFGSGSKILNFYAPANRICFFYLHTGREVARIEIPAWVADDPEMLDLTHSLSVDQARKGDGYPVALAEAHEQAIVRGAERDAFFRLMEKSLVGMGQQVATTQKALSKRARRV